MNIQRIQNEDQAASKQIAGLLESAVDRIRSLEVQVEELNKHTMGVHVNPIARRGCVVAHHEAIYAAMNRNNESFSDLLVVSKQSALLQHGEGAMPIEAQPGLQQHQEKMARLLKRFSQPTFPRSRLPRSQRPNT